jgi:hypothetical protein
LEGFMVTATAPRQRVGFLKSRTEKRVAFCSALLLGRTRGNVSSTSLHFYPLVHHWGLGTGTLWPNYQLYSVIDSEMYSYVCTGNINEKPCYQVSAALNGVTARKRDTIISHRCHPHLSPIP